MAGKFFAAPIDTPGLERRLAEHAPQNPFCSQGYFRAMQRLGTEPWIAGMEEGGRLISAAGVFVRRGRLNSTAKITSLPAAAGTDEYWDGLFNFCSERGITIIEGDSYCSPSVAVPHFKLETERWERQEYLLDLTGSDLDKQIHSKHRQNIRRANAFRLILKQGVGQNACREHVRLMSLSHQRRRARGEQIIGRPIMDLALAIIECGSGEIFQAVLDNNVLSSGLVCHSSSGAYYQSAGTTPEGMTMGASHFLIYSVACHLRAKGIATFNLGGALEGSSLARFKSRFGAVIIRSTALSLYVGSVWRRQLTGFLHFARLDRKQW